MAEQARRAGVIGHPIRHSRSPLIHGHWLRKHSLGGSYEAVDVEPSAAATFISSLAANGWAGCNVTIPHKETAFATVGRRTGEAEAIGAVNTIWHENGVLCGDNTDAYGFSCNLDDFAPGWDSGRKAAVIGAGGAARAIVHALSSRGFNRIDIVNRTVARAKEIAARFGDGVNAGGWDKLPHALAGADLVVNTTSLGMEGEGAMDIGLEPVPAHAIVTDIVYVPLVTPFLQAAGARDLKIVDGLGMLLHQAVPGFERWFGLRPEVTPELRALVVADMEKH